MHAAATAPTNLSYTFCPCDTSRLHGMSGAQFARADRVKKKALMSQMVKIRGVGP